MTHVLKCGESLALEPMVLLYFTPANFRPPMILGTVSKELQKAIKGREKRLLTELMGEYQRWAWGRGFPDGSAGEESVCKAGDIGNKGLIPGWGISPGGGKWQPTPVSLPKKSHGQRSWWATVQSVAKNWTLLKHNTTITEWGRATRSTFSEGILTIDFVRLIYSERVVPRGLSPSNTGVTMCPKQWKAS